VVFDDEMLTRRQEITLKVCEDFEAELEEFNGERDTSSSRCTTRPRSPSPSWSTVSRGLRTPPAAGGTSWPKAGGEFTGRSNHALMHGHLWSPSSFSAPCGGAPLAIVRPYIEQQKRPL
jgi:putative transposase